MERQGDKASPRASSRPRFIAEAQPQHHPGTKPQKYPTGKDIIK